MMNPPPIALPFTAAIIGFRIEFIDLVNFYVFY